MSTEPALILSLRPCFADLVFEGLKHAELRRRIVQGIENRHVFIYVTSPVRHLRGGFRVEHVWKGTPNEIWKQVSNLAGVDKGDFDAYYQGRTVAYALKIADVWEYSTPIELDYLRCKLGRFIVPQSWRYVRHEEYDLFQKMYNGGNTSAKQSYPTI